jgi:hypothetical protein
MVPDMTRTSVWLLALLPVLLGACALGSGSAPPTATPPARASTADLRTHLAYLHARSLSPHRHFSVTLSGGHVLYVVHSLCTGSADGHCQAVDAFLDAQVVPLFDHHYASVAKLVPIPGGFTVTAQSYRASDPLCCPSGPTVTDRLVWNGRTLKRSGASQGQQGSS